MTHKTHTVRKTPSTPISPRPPVILGLRPRYPPSSRSHPAGTGVHRRISPHRKDLLSILAAALPHVHGLSPARSTTAAPPASSPITGRRSQPHPHAKHARARTRGQDLPVFTCCPLPAGGTRLSACGPRQRLPRSTIDHQPHQEAVTPPLSSPRTTYPHQGIRHTTVRARPSIGFHRRSYVKTGTNTGSSRIPLRLARRAHAIRQY